MMKLVKVSFALLVLSSPLLSSAQADSNSKNITTDFTNTGLVTFTPQNAWVPQDLSPACGSSFQNETGYVTSLTSSSLQLKFTGTAVYVFGIRSNTSGLASFTLDQSTIYSRVFADSLSCDALLYSSAGNLSNTQHELVVSLFSASQNGNGSTEATLEITRILYTQDGSTPSSKKSSVAPIVGGVIGGVAAVLLAALGYVWYRKNRRHYRYSDSNVKEVAQLPIEPDYREADLMRKPTMSRTQPTPYTLSPVSESGASGSEDGRRQPSFSITEDGETTVGDRDRPQYMSRRTFSSGDSSISKARALSPIPSGSTHNLSPTNIASGSGSQAEGVSISDFVDRVAQVVAARVMGGAGASTHNLAVPQGGNNMQGDLDVEPPPEYVERNTEGEAEEGSVSPTPMIRAPADRKGR